MSLSADVSLLLTRAPGRPSRTVLDRDVSALDAHRTPGRSTVGTERLQEGQRTSTPRLLDFLPNFYDTLQSSR